MSNWNKVIVYFNSKRSNKIFTRAEVLASFWHRKRQTATIQTYINTLKRGGYLKYEEPGVYRKLKHIPEISEHQMKKNIRIRD